MLTRGARAGVFLIAKAVELTIQLQAGWTCSRVASLAVKRLARGDASALHTAAELGLCLAAATTLLCLYWTRLKVWPLGLAAAGGMLLEGWGLPLGYASGAALAHPLRDGILVLLAAPPAAAVDVLVLVLLACGVARARPGRVSL